MINYLLKSLIKFRIKFVTSAVTTEYEKPEETFYSHFLGQIEEFGEFNSTILMTFIFLIFIRK